METVRARGGPLCRGYMDFEKYGQDCMENDCVTKTEFGLLRIRYNNLRKLKIA